MVFKIVWGQIIVSDGCRYIIEFSHTDIYNALSIDVLKLGASEYLVRTGIIVSGQS